MGVKIELLEGFKNNVPLLFEGHGTSHDMPFLNRYGLSRFRRRYEIVPTSIELGLGNQLETFCDLS